MSRTRRYPRRFLFGDKMTQMTQSLGARSAPLGQLGQRKNNDPNDPMVTGQRRQLAI
jgi:hypothetical protein